MTEMEWLKQESGLTDEELDSYKEVLGAAKFKTMLNKLQATKDDAAAKAAKAEEDRLNLEKQWADVYQPELRKVTQDSLRNAGDAARYKAELEQAKKYAIVTYDPNPAPAHP